MININSKLYWQLDTQLWYQIDIDATSKINSELDNLLYLRISIDILNFPR
jgi:hypothetical protein